MSGTDGRVVVVTGGTRGIGLGLAREFLARGCRVVICGRSDAAVAHALGELGAGERATGLATDVTDRAAVQALWEHAVAAYGRVDVWINNAGISAPHSTIVAADPKTVSDVFAVNVSGAHNGCAVAGAGMATQPGGGWVWNMEGFGSDGRIQAGIGIYGASKRAVRYLTEALVKEHKESPVKIGFLSPGIVVTDLLVGDYDGKPEAFAKAKKVFNILGDKVETVTPYLAEKVLAAQKNGARVEWLTNAKAARRFMGAGFRKRDLFAEAG
ncbi:SDR family NAD(P)-dependent oxidoreductase [Nocardioides sp. dk4132]|uniref:SDR family oxidoreductase n=1 Tax=unclassified Nocardioides TaxID=2615069 RepID=UPI001295841F|nr:MULTISPECIES: SDR family oxidoreductase [unclassified Nocardioides]MQW76785.1 SDR family NAD(P)-dependent oxidoreductase [Nocardioides sp. dk4132]QGA06863.1 SDR family NAD(P)-dependent oxidoreductase [Nocardioides sp. dk884]